MATKETFLQDVQSGYSFKGGSIPLGRAMLNGSVVDGADISIPLRAMNRHGLIAGATGTGKTKSLQMISEGLSTAGVPVMLLDIKGDLSGLAAPGQESDRIKERAQLLNIQFLPSGFPVELLTLSSLPGVRLRATVSEFGPVLLSKILGLNDTQGGIVSLIFKYCDDNRLPLLDLKDFTRVLQYITTDGKASIEKEYGKISGTSVSTILRKVIELQQQGGDAFFGEPSFDVNDLMRTSPDGHGIISILRVTELQNRPKLFSTFMLQLLAELYATAPEVGDPDKPRLVLFIDEAHLVFDEATPVLLDEIENVIKLIRSKGIGVFFCTQNPVDIPASVLSQLGLKVQHALRAFTAADRKSIRQAAENYPESSYYDVDALITQLGTGEAFVTTLNEKGIPTPLVHVMMRPPLSRMDVLTDGEVQNLVMSSQLAGKYNTPLDTESAHEILGRKMEAAAAEAEQQPARGRKPAAQPAEKSILDNPYVKSAGRTAVTILTRSLLGVLGLGGSGRRRRSF
ncbi:MAG TPA: helicase HerA-like domain-containing protein [Flavisolibacter sp.]